MQWPIGRRVERRRLQRDCVCGPPAKGLYGSSDTALRRSCDPTGRCTNLVAAMIRSTEEKMMKKATAISCMFLDIGGVLLTDGWDHHARKRAATNFKLEWTEMEDRHHLVFETYEEGKLTLEEYLGRVIFHEKRPFSRAQFRRFMFAQSKPYLEMIGLVAQLKVRYGLKIAVVSNEARELNAYRIRKFKLDGFVDFFISSCFVHVRKPDADIFRLALDIAQAPAEQVVYIENTPMFVADRGRDGDSKHSSHGLQVHLRETGVVRIAVVTKESRMKPVDSHILTINGGSSSIKFALFEAGDSLRRILEGGIERIGLPEANLRVKGLKQADNFSRLVTAPDHTVAVSVLMDLDRGTRRA